MRDSETEQAMLEVGQSEMRVDGIPMGELRLCPQCESRFVAVGICAPCVQWNEHMEAKRLREGRHLTPIERHQAGIEFFDEPDDCDPPVAALMVILACEAAVVGIFVVGAWYSLKGLVECLLRWSASA